MRKPAEERFWEKVDASGVCWEWTAYVTKVGYGSFYAGRPVLAHRWAWEWLIGPIPEGMTIDHRCKNTRCVNPDHLEVATLGENAKGSGKCIAYRTRLKCGNGHPMTAENTFSRADGHGRRCRTCRREYNTAYMRRRRNGGKAA